MLALLPSMLNLLPREVLYDVCNALSWPLSSPPLQNEYSHPDERKGHKALAYLARTCHLHGPAVSALWSTIYNIHVLIGTLPDDLWLKDAIEDSVGLQPVRASSATSAHSVELTWSLVSPSTDHLSRPTLLD